MLRILLLLCSSALLAAAAATSADTASSILYFDLDAAVKAESLTYEEQLVAFVFQGLVNHKDAHKPTLMFNAGFMNFDWPASDSYWRSWLTEHQRAAFTNVSGPATLCSLVTNADPEHRIAGVVLYATGAAAQQEEWALPIATTLGSQQRLLPVTAAVRAKHPCLKSMTVGADLTKEPALGDRDAAWAWAFEHLLPHASTRVAYNLYHYAPQIAKDPQSNATLANVDWAVQQGAFIMNFKTSGNPASAVNPLFSKALANMEPLFSAYGWTDDEFGFVWMTENSGASPDGTPNNAAAGGGGAVFCSFATPNLSFWKLLPLPGGRTQALPLPVFDRQMPLDKTKSYVQIETNEGDTPRIVVSAFSSAWTDDRRGSLPISWAIDPVLGEEFPALFDFFSTTAGANDSFISGPGGCGYVYLGNMTDPQIKSFASRCGRLMKTYGPAVVDTFGQQGVTAPHSVEALANFSRYAAEAGVAPEFYVSQPTGNIHYSYRDCQSDSNDTATWQPDGTPVLCTPHSTFYVMGSLGGKELASRINAVVAAAPKPAFVTVYGGLRWTTTSERTRNESLYSFWGDTIQHLDAGIVPVGAQEMARLARAAGSA